MTVHAQEHEHSEGHGGPHITPISHYLAVFVALLVLMAATVAASYVHFGATWINNVVAMAIALTKATLVVLIFMQVKYATRLTWLWAAVGFIWLILLFGILGDFITRDWVPVGGW